MHSLKEQRDASEPTQPQRSRRFVRRNSFCTLICRSGSLNKKQNNSEQLKPSTHQHKNIQSKTTKIHAETQQFINTMRQPLQPTIKRGSGSMRVKPCRIKEECLESQRFETLRKQLQTRVQEVQILEGQCKRLKLYISQERLKRKTLQEQVICGQLQIKRLQRRLQKCKVQNVKLEQDKQIAIQHIQILQQATFQGNTRQLQSYRQTFINQELNRLRGQLSKGRSQRQKQLQNEVQKLKQIRFAIESQLKAIRVANIGLSKQLQSAEQQIEFVRRQVHQTVICSTEYVELRERYRRMLLEFKQLKKELSVMENSWLQHGRTLLDRTFLTVSESNNDSICNQ